MPPKKLAMKTGFCEVAAQRTIMVAVHAMIYLVERDAIFKPAARVNRVSDMTKKMTRGLLVTLLGSIVLVVWGMIFWGLLADPLGLFHSVPKADAVTVLLQENDTLTGTYFFPWPRSTPETFQEFVRQHKRGPFFKLSYVREGVDPNSPAKLARGCLHYLTVSAMAVAILWLVHVRSFVQRAAVIVLGGMMGTNFISVADPVWFHLPWDYARGSVIYESVSWLLLAVVTAALVRPDPNMPKD